MRNLLCAGSPIPVAVLDRARQALPGVGFVQAYGQTELAPVATLLGPQSTRTPSGRSCSAPGRAAPHAEVRIVDGDDNSPRWRTP